MSACGDTDDQAVTWPRPGAGLRAMSWSPIDQVQGQPSSAWRCCTTNLPAALQAFAVVSVTWSRSMSCAISHASIRSSVHSPCGRVPLRRPGCTPNAPKRRYEPSVRCSTWPSLGCRRAADHRSKFFRRQGEQDWRSRGRSRGTRGASVRANDPAAAVRRQKLASGPATSCSSCLFPRAHYFVELKRETLGAFAVSARDVIAQLANKFSVPAMCVSGISWAQSWTCRCAVTFPQPKHSFVTISRVSLACQKFRTSDPLIRNTQV